jgi:hypothetical protein
MSSVRFDHDMDIFPCCKAGTETNDPRGIIDLSSQILFGHDGVNQDIGFQKLSRLLSIWIYKNGEVAFLPQGFYFLWLGNEFRPNSLHLFLALIDRFAESHFSSHGKGMGNLGHAYFEMGPVKAVGDPTGYFPAPSD